MALHNDDPLIAASDLTKGQGRAGAGRRLASRWLRLRLVEDEPQMVASDNVGCKLFVWVLGRSDPIGAWRASTQAVERATRHMALHKDDDPLIAASGQNGVRVLGTPAQLHPTGAGTREATRPRRKPADCSRLRLSCGSSRALSSRP